MRSVAPWKVKTTALRLTEQAASLLQFLRKGHFLRKNCKKSFRSPKATMLKDHPAQLNESNAPTICEALYSNVKKDCSEQMRARKKVLRVQLNRFIILIPSYAYSETEG
jgi:hypothetical protein